MANWKQIKAEDWKENIFHLLDKEWTLITAQRNDGSSNQMTASWGGFGILWGKPVAFLFVRPERYTHLFMTDDAKISLSFFDEAHRAALAYCGKHSGREGDKSEKAGLSPVSLPNGFPSYQEARLAISLKKLFQADMREEQFVEKEMLKFYQKDGFHTVYVCEILEINGR